MPEIKLKARIQNKYETLEEWNKLVEGEFIPLKGEVCYGIEQGKLYQKIGDGETDFVNLPWVLNQSDWSEYDYTSPQFIHSRPGGYWQAIDTTEKSTAFTLNYTDDEIDLSSDLGVFGGLNLTKLDERLLNFPTSFDLVIKNNTFEVAKFTDIKINKPLPFIVEPGLEVYYQGNIYSIIKELTGLTSKEEINSLGIYDTGELYGFVLMVEKEEPYAGITFWLSPEFKTATSVDFNIYDCDFVPLPINYTNLDTSEFVGRFDETNSNSKFAEIFNDYVKNEAIGDYSHAEGLNSQALGPYTHVEGRDGIAEDVASHVEGSNSYALGGYSHAEGATNFAGGNYSHVEGGFSTLRGTSKCTILEINSNAYDTKVKVHVESGYITDRDFVPDYSCGILTKEGPTVWHKIPISNELFTVISYDASTNIAILKSTAYYPINNANSYINQTCYFHDLTQHNNGGALGDYSHSEGHSTLAFGTYSHSEGNSTIAIGECQHTQGKYNKVDTEGKLAFIIGNGTYDNPSNAMTVDWNGQITANDYQVFTTDENGEIVSKSIQSDMEQSDPTQIDYIKNRTHYKELVDFNEYQYISDSENWQDIINADMPYKEINQKFDLDADASYQLKMDVYVKEDGAEYFTLGGTQTYDLTITNFTRYFNIPGFEDVLALYSDDLEQLILINGIEGMREAVINENMEALKQSDTNSYLIFIPEMPPEYYYQFTLIGPGFNRQEMQYTKIPAEYLPDPVVTKEPLVVNYITNFPYDGLFLYDTIVGEDYYKKLHTERVDYVLIGNSWDHRTLNIDGYYETYESFDLPGYYKIISVDTENKKFTFVNCEDTSTGEGMSSTRTYEYTVDYIDSAETTKPVVNMLIGLDVAITKEDGITYVPWRYITKPGGSSVGDFVDLVTIKKPAGYNKLRVTSKVRSISDDLNQDYEFSAPAFVISNVGIFSVEDKDENKFYKGLDCYGIDDVDNIYASGGVSKNISSVTFGASTLHCLQSEDSPLQYGCQQVTIITSFEVIFEDDQITIEGEQGLCPHHYGSLGNELPKYDTSYGPSYGSQRLFIRKSKDCTKFDKFTDDDLSIVIFTSQYRLQDQHIRFVWEE